MNNLPWRRILTVLIFVLLVLLIAFLLYWAFFGPENQPVGNNAISNGQLPNINGGVNRPVGNKNTSAGLPITNESTAPSPTANGGPTIVNPLVNTPTKYSTLSGNGVDLIYYDPVTGKFYQIDRNGMERRVLSDQVFKGLTNVAWSSSRQLAVLTFLDGRSIVYDFLNKQQVSLPSELEEFSFSPDSTKIAAKYIGPVANDNWLAVVSSDGTSATQIEALGDKVSQVQVNWSPNSQIVATYQESIDGDRQAIVPLGAKNENFKAIETNGRGFVGQYDRTGTRMLYSVYNSTSSYNPELHIVEANGDSIGRNNINLSISTWADKCAFGASGKEVYCAVPIGLSPGSGLYPELANEVPFEFMKIDVTTGLQQRLAQPTDADGIEQYSVGSVYLAGTEDVLYFTDPEGKVNTIKLE